MQGASLIPIGLESFARDFLGLHAVVRVPTTYGFTDKIHIRTYPQVRERERLSLIIVACRPVSAEVATHATLPKA